MARNTQKGRRLKGYYKFQKKYPSKNGSVYEIGESRKMKAKERTTKIAAAVLCLCLFSFVYIGLSVAHKLSVRPLPKEDDNSPVVTVESVSKIKAKYIDNRQFKNLAVLDDALKSAKEQGFNSVIVDFKDSSGYLTYGSSLLNGVDYSSINIISEQAIEKIKNEGFMLVARIFCFEDSLSPQRLNAFVYSDFEKGLPWFDNPPAKNGKIWLNPANSASHDYLCRVIKEVSALSVDCIYICSAEWAVAGSSTVPVFSQDDTLLQKNAVLNQFITSAVDASGSTPLILGTDLDAFEKGNAEKYGGTLTDTAAVIGSPLIENTQGEDYISLAENKTAELREAVKSNFTTIKIVPTIKMDSNDKEFYDKLEKSSLDSYFIVP